MRHPDARGCGWRNWYLDGRSWTRVLGVSAHHGRPRVRWCLFTPVRGQALTEYRWCSREEAALLLGVEVSR